MLLPFELIPFPNQRLSLIAFWSAAADLIDEVVL